jgi:hypothetical protein
MKTKSEQALCAAAIRAELRKQFPKNKFKVTSEVYAGGTAVWVVYQDGFDSSLLSEILNKYQYGHFDGQRDIYEYSNRNENLPQVKFVLAQKEY